MPLREIFQATEPSDVEAAQRRLALTQALQQRAMQPHIPVQTGAVASKYTPATAIADLAAAVLSSSATRDAENAYARAKQAQGAKVGAAMNELQTSTPDAQVGAQSLQNLRASPDGELPDSVTPRSVAQNDLAAALGPDARQQIAGALLSQSMAPPKPAEPYTLSQGQQRRDAQNRVVAELPAAPPKRSVEWKDQGDRLVPVYSDTGEDVPGLKPKMKNLTPTQAAGAAISDQGKEFAYQTYLSTGKLPTTIRNASAQRSMLDYIAKRAAEDGNTAQAITAGNQATKAAGETLKQFTAGKKGDTVRSLNVAVQHLDQLSELGQALQNGDVQLFNRLGNAWAKQTGGAAPVTFDAMKKIVADELVKAVVGTGGGVADREEAAHSLDAVQSPEQMASVISNYKGLMGGQLNGLRKQYEEGTGRDDFERFLLPVTKGELEKHDAPKGPVQIKSDADFDALPSGTEFIGPDGKHRRKP